MLKTKNGFKYLKTTMGMFSNLQVKTDLPLTEELKALSINWKNVVFQTKDLNYHLSNYIITEKGELVLENIEYEYVYYTEEEKKQKDFKPWNLVKESIEKSRTIEKIDFHGKISFYSYEDFSETEDIWVDFEAYFSYGKLDKIKLIKAEKTTSYKVTNEEWSKKSTKQKAKLSYKLKKSIGWFWFWGLLGDLCTKASWAFQRLNILIVKYLL